MNERKRSQTLIAVGAGLLVVFILLLCLASYKKMPPLQVGICFRNTQQNSEYCAILEKALIDAGCRVTVVNAENDGAKQAEQVSAFVSSGVDVLILEPVANGETDTLAQQATQAGIAVVFVGTEPQSGENVSFVGPDKKDQGALQSSILQKNADKGDKNDDGVISYLIIAGPEADSAAQAYAQSAAAGLAELGLETAAISVLWTDGTQANGRTACAQALAQYGKDIEVILCASDLLAFGALEAVEEGGWQVGRDYYLLGIGGSSQALELIKNGRMTGTVSEQYALQAQKVVEQIGKTTPDKIYVQCLPVNWENP